MNETLQIIVNDFIKKYVDEEKRILFALSGGYDSMALLHLLLSSNLKFLKNLHIVHVDHGWRDESKIEAEILRKIAKKNNFKFHLKKLDLKNDAKDLENICRIERLKFFKKIYEKYSCQAVIIAHHKDDLIETTLKRIFEGSFLQNFSSIQKISTYDDMKILRPLLKVSKKDILSFLENLNITAFDDRTNRDLKFLRSRFRLKIIPYLEKEFGKNFTENIYQHSIRANELKKYLDKKVNILFENIFIGFFGIIVDLTKDELEKIEFIHLIKKVANFQKMDLSRDILEKLFEFYFEKKNNKRVKIKNYHIIFDKNFLFIVKSSFFNKILKNFKIVQNLSKNELKGLFSGELYCPVKNLENFELKFPKPGEILNGKRLKDIWYKHKIFAFLRFNIPCLYEKDKIVFDFLSDKSCF